MDGRGGARQRELQVCGTHDYESRLTTMSRGSQPNHLGIHLVATHACNVHPRFAWTGAGVRVSGGSRYATNWLPKWLGCDSRLIIVIVSLPPSRGHQPQRELQVQGYLAHKNPPPRRTLQ